MCPLGGGRREVRRNFLYLPFNLAANLKRLFNNKGFKEKKKNEERKERREGEREEENSQQHGASKTPFTSSEITGDGNGFVKIESFQANRISLLGVPEGAMVPYLLE